MANNFSEKPEEVQDAIETGDIQRLSRMGKEGAKKRAEGIAMKEMQRERYIEDVAQQEFDRLLQLYPDKDPVDLRKEAREVAEAIVKMKERMVNMEKKSD